MAIPKTIWFLWLQGLDNAPLVVRKCHESWLKHNPGWTITFLDETNIPDFVSLPDVQITRQSLSDVLRINLLAKYGGIWVDATCYCVKPLDLWIDQYTAQGFFAFERPTPDRMISSWFLACDQNNYLVLAYQQAVNNYWLAHPDLVHIENSRWRSLEKYLLRRRTQIWFSYFVTRVLKVYPYFWFHYLFEKIYLGDEKFRIMWDQVPKISADIPHALQFAGLLNPPDGKTKQEIDNQISPCYKLTWKYDTSAPIEGTVLGYLFQSIG